MGQHWLVGGVRGVLAGVFEQTAATASKLIMCQCLLRLLSLHKERQVEGTAGEVGSWVLLPMCPRFCRVSALRRWPCNAVL